MQVSVSLSDCANLAHDVYGNFDSRMNKWSRQEFGEWNSGTDGFYGAAYRNYGSSTVVIAIRGTQERQDMMDDLYMVPKISGARAETALKTLIRRYLGGFAESSPGAVDGIPMLVREVFSTQKAQRAINNGANQIPPQQAQDGYNFMKSIVKQCEQKGCHIAAIVGHSLGGAVAQYLAQNTGPGGKIRTKSPIPAVAFNAPYMGSISGMHNGRGGQILAVNCVRDPLSLITRLVGNTSNATQAPIEIRQRNYLPFPDPVGPNPSLNELKNFGQWLGKAAQHFHSMENMVKLVATRQNGVKLHDVMR